MLSQLVDDTDLVEEGEQDWITAWPLLPRAHAVLILVSSGQRGLGGTAGP